MIKIYFTALKKLIQVINLVLQNFLRLMSKYTGTEAKIVPNEETDEWIKSYESIHGQNEDYTKFEVFGRETILKLNVPGAVALRIYNGWREGQTCLILRPVDRDGKELGVPVVMQGMKDGKGGGSGGSGPRCPVSC